jgi:hypothetical protein
MVYYIFIKDEKIEGKGQCKQLTEGVLNIEVEQEIYNDIEKYIYKDGEIILNPNYEAEQELKERERIAKLKLTKREVFLGLYQAKGVTPDMIKAQITDPQALIEFEYANDYYRGNPLIDIVGATLGITPEQLDKFFETNDYTCLLPIEVENDNTENTTL